MSTHPQLKRFLLILAALTVAVPAQWTQPQIQQQMTQAMQPMRIQPISQQPGTATAFQSVRAEFGVLSAEVPQGWSAELLIGDASVNGHLIHAWSPDGRWEVRYAHNWAMLSDFQTGGYLAGNQAIERWALPLYAQEIAAHGYQVQGVLSRSQNTRTNLSDPAMAAYGMQMPLDSGALTFSIRSPQGEQLMGQAYAETLRIYEMPDATTGMTWGMYSVRIVKLAVSPTDAASQQMAQIMADHLCQSVQFSQQYLQSGQQAFNTQQQIIQQHSSDMTAIQQQTWNNRQQAQDRAHEQFIDYIRGEQTMVDPNTGQQYQTGYDQNEYYVNPQGNIVGSQGGAPTPDGNWQQLQPANP